MCQQLKLHRQTILQAIFHMYSHDVLEKVFQLMHLQVVHIHLCKLNHFHLSFVNDIFRPYFQVNRELHNLVHDHYLQSQSQVSQYV